ncbi:Signal recognition particle subunit SRP72 [Aphelenchoides bicaudatus]|nr:Signal recognition particle subunit SRP72 [Aphelenchoides bicaudatus]
MAANANQLRAQLISAEENQDYHKLLETANQLVALNPSGVPVHKFKLVALIKLGLFEEALKLIKEVPAKQLGDTTVARCYILYRQNKNEEALAELNKADAEDPSVLELKAQLYYRMNRFQEAHDIYRTLCRDLDDDDFEDLRRANLLAATAKLEESGTHKDPTTSELDTHEQLYNQACHLIACKQLGEASKFLKLAEDRCVETLKADGFSEKEIQDEMKPIITQRKYIAHQLKLANKTKANKIKRKRKPRLPKNYDPNVKPDEERWLPRQERTAYKKKLNKKYKDRNVGRGTQGTSSANAEKIDYSNATPKESTQSPKPAQTTPQPEGPRQQGAGQRKQQQKKKKGKGRW